jgi:hypothetical protein
MSDIVKIKLWLPDQKALHNVLSKVTLELDCGSPQNDGQGNFIVNAYATPQEAKKISGLGYKFELDEAFGKTLKLRQKEVAKGDRFQGGKIAPEGLGVKK